MNDRLTQVNGITYARARLWLGICGVGSVVMGCTIALTLNLPTALLPASKLWHLEDLTSLASLAAVYVLFMVPFDFMGGYILPKRYGKCDQPLIGYFWNWLRGVTIQSTAYVVVATALLAFGRVFGLLGCLAFVAFAFLAFLVGQSFLAWLVSGRQANRKFESGNVNVFLGKWNVTHLPVAVAGNSDPGFTGGVVGLPYFESVIIGDNWLSRLSSEELAAVIARRCVAVASGARTLGLATSMAWILVGFAGSTLLPLAGVASVAGLVTTLAGFTLWTFFGLLVLPTISRRATHLIDDQVVSHGVTLSVLKSALTKLDQEQDDEATRTALVETIFHPVPSLTTRVPTRAVGLPTGWHGWHVARTTLFLTWCCAGLLSRAVHCNVGRPELWILLPTD